MLAPSKRGPWALLTAQAVLKVGNGYDDDDGEASSFNTTATTTTAAASLSTTSKAARSRCSVSLFGKHKNTQAAYVTYSPLPPSVVFVGHNGPCESARSLALPAVHRRMRMGYGHLRQEGGGAQATMYGEGRLRGRVPRSAGEREGQKVEAFVTSPAWSVRPSSSFKRHAAF